MMFTRLNYRKKAQKCMKFEFQVAKYNGFVVHLKFGANIPVIYSQTLCTGKLTTYSYTKI